MLYVQIFSDDFSLNLKFRKQEKLIVRGVNTPSWEYRRGDCFNTFVLIHFIKRKNFSDQVSQKN